MINIVTNTRKILANNVSYFRMKNNWSQDELSEKMGSKLQYISEIENAKRNISCDYIDRLAQVFNIKPSELLVSRPEVKNRRIPRRCNKR